jgi:6-phosphogluconate dehydrogenase
MQIGFIGLGKMGLGMSTRTHKAAHETHGFAPSQSSRDEAQKHGITTHDSVKNLVSALDSPRIIFTLVPAGKVTHSVISELTEYLDEDDIVIDAGNSYFKDSQEHFSQLQENGIHFLDCGTSGGLKGEEVGYSLMIGGRKDIFDYVSPVFQDIAAPEAYQYMGDPGSGHYVKMVHNGVEYAIMESMAEGFELIENGPYDVDIRNVSQVWKNASIIRSYLMDLAHEAFQKDPKLNAHTDYVSDNGMGRWTVNTAIEHGVPAPAISDAVYARFRSQQNQSFAGKTLAALRNEFGGHAVQSTEKEESSS